MQNPKSLKFRIVKLRSRSRAVEGQVQVREYFMESIVFRWTQEEKEIIWVRNGQGWFQLNLKETLQGRLKDYSLSHNSKDKSHFKF